MLKKAFVVILLAVILTIFLTATARADGGLFGKGGRDIFEPEQKAVVFYHEGQEEIILSVSYEGAAEEFAWLVPLPEPPRIEECDFAVFEIMSALAPSEVGHWGTKNAGTMGLDESAVFVTEELTVGPYDVTVVRASDAGELRTWLQDRGFYYDDEAEEVLGDYIERGWCFVAMRINPAEIGEAQGMLGSGTIDPLRFTFQTFQPVYPLYISSLNPGSSEVLVYVLGDEVYEHPDMTLEFADIWQGVQAGALGEFSELAKAMERSGGCAVSKLRGTFWPSEMEDLYLVPASTGELAEFELAAASVGGEEGDSFPLWAIPIIVLILAGLITVISELVRTGESGSPLRIFIVFIVSGVIISGIFIPLGLKNGESAGEKKAAAAADWPWEEDIIIADNGWQKALHPDGTMEVIGLESNLRYLLEEEEEMYLPSAELYYWPYNNNLDEEGYWKWREEHFRADVWQTKYFVVYNDEGEEYQFDLGMKEIHDARLSPRGDRLWIAVNPGVPVNKTEVLEYSFPDLSLERSVIHDYSLRMGSIVLSKEGSPLMGGYFDRDIQQNGEYMLDIYIGLLPMLEENTEFDGEALHISDEDIQSVEDSKLIGIVNGYFCDAIDGSPFLLVQGNDMEDFDGIAYVFDTRDGELYEVAKGFGTWKR